jgi:hypothetical protein
MTCLAQGRDLLLFLLVLVCWLYCQDLHQTMIHGHFSKSSLKHRSNFVVFVEALAGVLAGAPSIEVEHRGESSKSPAVEPM